MLHRGAFSTRTFPLARCTSCEHCYVQAVRDSFALLCIGGAGARDWHVQVEAGSALNGVGLVRLMGRSSGFITMEASMASGAWSNHWSISRYHFCFEPSASIPSVRPCGSLGNLPV
jgi:hypothetical protein